MILTLITFLIILSILVLVHELGHFIVAKKTGIKVEEFGFGIPPRLWAKKIGETVYSVNALPIGGFVKLYGEEISEQEGGRAEDQEERMFFAKSKKVRLAVIVAGVLMNFLLALGVFSFVYAKLGIPTETDKVRIIGILPGSPAEKAGLKLEDMVLMAGGEIINSTEKFSEITKKFFGKEIPLEISRQGEKISIKVVPRETPPPDEGPVGVVISQTELKFYPFFEQIYRGMIEGLKESWGWIKLVFYSLKMTAVQLITDRTVPKDIAGPVGILQVTGIVSQGGVIPVLQFLGILSINLAVINILPIPAMDGGRALFVIIESVFGRKVRPHIESWIHNVGMMILLFLLLLITINDVLRLLDSSGTIGRLRSILPF